MWGKDTSTVTTDLTWNLINSYLLTPWSRVLVEKLTGFQLVKKFPVFYGTRKFITAFASARHLCLSFLQVTFTDDSRKIRFFAIPYAVPFLTQRAIRTLCRFVLEPLEKPSHAEGIVICRVVRNLRWFFKNKLMWFLLAWSRPFTR